MVGLQMRSATTALVFLTQALNSSSTGLLRQPEHSVRPQHADWQQVGYVRVSVINIMVPQA